MADTYIRWSTVNGTGFIAVQMPLRSDCISLVDTDHPLSTINSIGVLAINVLLALATHLTGNLNRV
jgi:hypothetical protein